MSILEEQRRRDAGSSDERRQFFQDVEDLKEGSLNLPGHEELVEKVVSKLKKNENTDEAREMLRKFDAEIADADGEEESLVKVLNTFIGSELGSEEDDSHEVEGWGDDRE